eukprot:1522448-Rhodomonas_salina.1
MYDTHIAYALRSSDEVACTHTAYALRSSYEMSGTDLRMLLPGDLEGAAVLRAVAADVGEGGGPRYGGEQRTAPRKAALVSYLPTCIACYPRTGLAVSPTRSPVLNAGMVLPVRYYGEHRGPSSRPFWQPGQPLLSPSFSSFSLHFLAASPPLFRAQSCHFRGGLTFLRELLGTEIRVHVDKLLQASGRSAASVYGGAAAVDVGAAAVNGDASAVHRGDAAIFGGGAAVYGGAAAVYGSGDAWGGAAGWRRCWRRCARTLPSPPACPA